LPGHIVPGIDFSDDPLLQGRLFSYLDTQLSRLGGPNFHQLPVNAPKCPMHNFSATGTCKPPFRAAASPTSRARWSRTARANRRARLPNVCSQRQRQRAARALASFADHFTQARLFFVSQTEPEQNHMWRRWFRAGKVETPAIRERMLSRLINVDSELAKRVAAGLGLDSLRRLLRPPRRKRTSNLRPR